MLKNIFFFCGKKSLFLENIIIFMIILIQYFSGLKMFNFSYYFIGEEQLKKVILLFLLFFLFIGNGYASTDSAYEYVLMDMTTGKVLQGKNYHNPMLIASITKIMTCLLAVESEKLDEEVIVDDVIKQSYGSGIYIEVDEKILLRDLLYGLMLRSGNDAALMVAKYVGGSVEEFVAMMNDKAKEIGMSQTRFSNPSGLDNTDSGNYSTAYDMALLTRYAMRYSWYRKIVATSKHVVRTNKKTYVWHNKNKLLKESYITGGKTGYTEKAKRTLVSTASSANLNLVVVTIKDSDDWNTHKSLYQYAFNHYTAYPVLKKKTFQVVGEKFYRSSGKLYIKNDVYLPLKNETVTQSSQMPVSWFLYLQKPGAVISKSCTRFYLIYATRNLHFATL